MNFLQFISKLQPCENVKSLVFSCDVHFERKHAFMTSSLHDIMTLHFTFTRKNRYTDLIFYVY